MQDIVFVIRKTPYLERDLIITAFSKQCGKVSYIARGAIRSKKRFAGGVFETANLIQTQSRPGKSAKKMISLIECKVIESFDHLRNDYDNIQFMYKVVKVIDAIDWTENEYARVFSLLKNILLEIGTESSLDQIWFIFLIKVLYLQGLLPFESEDVKMWLMKSVDQASEVDLSKASTQGIFRQCEHLFKELVPQSKY